MRSILLTAILVLAAASTVRPETADIDGISGASFEWPPALPRDEEELRSEVRQWIAGHWLMTLATTESDGAPHISGVVYSAKDFVVFFASKRESNKIRNIERDARVAYTIWDPVESIKNLKALQVKGRARILEGVERASASSCFPGHPFNDDYALVEVTPIIARWTDRSRPAEYTSVIRFEESATETGAPE